MFGYIKKGTYKRKNLGPHAHNIIIQTIQKHQEVPNPPASCCALTSTLLHGILISVGSSSSRGLPWYVSVDAKVCPGS
jgi:hypothetical protein